MSRKNLAVAAPARSRRPSTSNTMSRPRRMYEFVVAIIQVCSGPSLARRLRHGPALLWQLARLAAADQAPDGVVADRDAVLLFQVSPNASQLQSLAVIRQDLVLVSRRPSKRRPAPPRRSRDHATHRDGHAHLNVARRTQQSLEHVRSSSPRRRRRGRPYSPSQTRQARCGRTG
jgi:hypothetical protein